MALHVHISPEGWTIGPLVATVLRHTLSPHHNQSVNIIKENLKRAWSFKRLHIFILLHNRKSAKSKLYCRWPKVAADWLAFLLLFLDVRVSHLGPKTGYPDWGFRSFTQALKTNAGTVAQIRLWRFLSHPFQFINYTIIRRHMIWNTDSVVKLTRTK
jgi:hypothetical protein